MPIISIAQKTPNIPKSEEPTKDSPASEKQQAQKIPLTEAEKKRILDMVREYRKGWQWKRWNIVRRCLKSKEFAKGNQFLGFWPEGYETFDAIQEFQSISGQDIKNNDQFMQQRPVNFFQMLRYAFVSALSPQLPKVRFEPQNAEREEDRETAKAASTIETIIEKRNDAPTLLGTILKAMWDCGCYFRHTRYVVDSDDVGTHKEVVMQATLTNVVPARHVCPGCGAVALASDVDPNNPTCPECHAAFGPESYYEADEPETIPIATGEQDVPDAMVMQTVYDPLQVDADPDAKRLIDTPLINVEQEVQVAWLRTTFPDFWDKFQEGANTVDAESQQDRVFREMISTSSANYDGNNRSFRYAPSNKPTYARTWIQPWAFAALNGKDGRALAEKLQKDYPKGLMMAHVGEHIIDIRESKMSDEWTHGSTDSDFGLFPPGVGDAAVPMQERINNLAIIIDDYIDRLACGILLYNTAMIDGKAMNGKALRAGVLNPIALKKKDSVAAIEQAIFQVKTQLDAAIFKYKESLAMDMQLIAGTPPQLFGAGTQRGVDTASGQEQQLHTAMGKLLLFWNNVRQEAANAAQLGVQCAARNMTEDWINVVLDEDTDEHKNELVRLDQMKGSIRANPETDQGFPMSPADFRAFWMEMSTKQNDLTQQIFSVSANVDAAIRSTGIPDLHAPGESMRTKMLPVISKLITSKAIKKPMPDGSVVSMPSKTEMVNGQPIQLPLEPNKYLDDLAASQHIIEEWSQQNWPKIEANPDALENLVAYYKLCVQFEADRAKEKAMLGAQVQQAAGPQGGPSGPQQGAPQPPQGAQA